MTTNVIIQAHCAEEKRVQIVLKNKGQVLSTDYLKDGEEKKQVVHDNLELTVNEVAEKVSTKPPTI